MALASPATVLLMALALHLTAGIDTNSSLPGFVSRVHGATVALVGPAAYIEGAGLQDIVALADVVARPNVKVDATTGALVLPSNTTRRCDLVYHSCAVESATATSWSALTTRTATVYMAAGVKELVAALSHSTVQTHEKAKERIKQFYALQNHFAKATLQHDLAKTAPRGQTNYNRRMNFRGLLENSSLYGCHVQPNFRTGVKMLVDLLLQQPLALYVLGCDFYSSQSTSKHHGFPGYYRDTQTPESASFHSTKEELSFFACLLEEGSAPILIDSHLADVIRAREPAAGARLKVVSWRAANALSSTLLYTGCRSSLASLVKTEVSCPGGDGVRART